jgi:betaine-aldehyde dehydrogenase
MMRENGPGLQGRVFSGHDWRMLIGGDLVQPKDGGRLQQLNPATGESLGSIPCASEADVDRAVAAASVALASWRRTDVRERARLLLTVAQTVEENGEELARLDSEDIGTPLNGLRRDIALTVEELRRIAGNATALRGETIPTGPGTIDLTVREPFGVVARIVAFNHPLMFGMARLGSPLLAGNTVVLKPAESSSRSALRMGELLRSVVPAGVVNIISGRGGEAGDLLVRHPDVARIAFIGGADAGRRIQQSAAATGVKTVTLELGGKNPLIVFGDADVDAAIEGAVRGMNFGWQGQSCGSTSRLYVHRSLFETVVSGIAERLDRIVVGDPLDPLVEMGSLSNRAQYEKVLAYLRQGLGSDQAQLRAGGARPSGVHPDGCFLRPTLFTVPVDTDLPLANEEIFGPVLVAAPFTEYDEVISAANRLPLGLTAAVYTTSLEIAMAAARDLEAGYVWVNWSATHIPGTAFGGVKNSGVGRDEGLDEILGFTQPKNIYVRFGGASA